MFEIHQNLLRLFGLLGKVSGRKKLQKIVYITQKAGINLNEDFSYHYYGPYSESLSNKIKELVVMGLIKEEIERTAYGYPQYTYSLTDKGRELLELFSVEGFTQQQRQLILTLNQYDSRFLELVATMWFLLEKGYTREKAEEEICTQLKPDQNYRHEEVTQAFEVITGLTLN
jgi:hypothetical protein